MTVSRVTFHNTRGQRLVGSIHRPTTAPRSGAVICHGMLSHRGSIKHQAIAQALALRGILTLRFDFTGRGESEGTTEEISYDAQLSDLAAAVALVKEEVEPVSLVGSSMGGAVAILYASTDPSIQRVATVAAVGRPDQVLEVLVGPRIEAQLRQRGTFEIAGFRLGPALLESSRSVDVVAAARQLDRPLLLIHGEGDDVVDLAQARELARVAPRSELEVIPGGDHILHGQNEQRWLVERIASFLGEGF